MDPFDSLPDELPSLPADDVSNRSRCQNGCEDDCLTTQKSSCTFTVVIHKSEPGISAATINIMIDESGL